MKTKIVVMVIVLLMLGLAKPSLAYSPYEVFQARSSGGAYWNFCQAGPYTPPLWTYQEGQLLMIVPNNEGAYLHYCDILEVGVRVQKVVQNPNGSYSTLSEPGWVSYGAYSFWPPIFPF